MSAAIRRVDVALAGAVIYACVTAATAFAAPPQITDRWLTVVTPAEPENLDGCLSARSFVGRVVKQNVVETLIEKDAADGSLKPRLATSWERVDDNTWRIKLRQNVSFHDEAPFNALAAKRSLDRTMGTALVCVDKAQFLGDLKLDIAAVDDMTLQIKTSRPEPILPTRLAGISIVGPNTPLDKFVLDPVGTGPYVFDSWQAGQQILLRRNEKYWGAKPQVEGIRYVWRGDSSVRAAMVKIGEADIAPIIAAQDAVDPVLDHAYLNSETTFIRIDASRAPLDDRRVRLALNYAVDRQSMVGTILPKSTLLATQVVIPSIPGHNHDLDKHPIPYDPQKAKQLLADAKAAGAPVDKEILLISLPTQHANAGEMMEAVQKMYRDVGLNIKLMTVETGQYTNWNFKPFPEDRPPYLLQSSHDNNFGDPVFSVFYKYGCDSTNSSFCDPVLDKEVLHVSALSGDERVKGWQEIFRNVYEDLAPVVFMFHMVGHARVSPRINFVPDVTTNSEIRAQEITFK